MFRQLNSRLFNGILSTKNLIKVKYVHIKYFTVFYIASLLDIEEVNLYNEIKSLWEYAGTWFEKRRNLQ